MNETQSYQVPVSGYQDSSRINYTSSSGPSIWLPNVVDPDTIGRATGNKAEAWQASNSWFPSNVRVIFLARTFLHMLSTSRPQWTCTHRILLCSLHSLRTLVHSLAFPPIFHLKCSLFFNRLLTRCLFTHQMLPTLRA